MNAHVTVITLGVDDLETAVAFYREGLGLKTDGVVGTEFEYGAVAFFELQPGVRLERTMRFGAATAGTSKIPTDISGKSSGTHNCRRLERSSKSTIDNSALPTVAALGLAAEVWSLGSWFFGTVKGKRRPYCQAAPKKVPSQAKGREP